MNNDNILKCFAYFFDSKDVDMGMTSEPDKLCTRIILSEVEKWHEDILKGEEEKSVTTVFMKSGNQLTIDLSLYEFDKIMIP